MSNNDITGDKLISRVNTKAFDENFNRIFGKDENRFNELSFNGDDFEIKPFVKPETEEVE